MVATEVRVALVALAQKMAMEVWAVTPALQAMALRDRRLV